ncbi:MAG: type II toxin-antitoxin system VapC family toxin [Actinomycetota bacterium]
MLDTHITLWWLSEDRRLPKKARSAVSDPENSIFVSSATIWESAIKATLGRLEVVDNLPEEIEAERFELMDITASQAWMAGFLPRHHEDPFDRMLAAQALSADLRMVSVDEIFETYGVKVLPLDD